ncbi:MAG: glycosyltransferase family 1 protein [Patescibacteria group bacterium]
MLIGIEATRANKTVKTGVEWYAWHVIQELKNLTLNDGNSWILYSNAPLAGGLEKLPENWYEMRLKWPLPYGWTQMRLSWDLRKHPIDVLWMPGSTLPRIMPKKTVVTVHDVGFHHLPKVYKPRQVHIHEQAMREIKKKAARIMTVSEFSGRDLAESYGIDPKNIAITYPGVDLETYRPITDAAEIEERLRRYRLSQPYYIYVGRLEAKKNILTLIKAFNQFKTQRGVGDPFKLALAGAPGFGYELIKQAINNSPVKSDILELGYVPETDKPYLMAGAEALVHPSYYEGFGIPPVEAMACGCPVISSNAASLPEILGDAALFFSPDEPEQLTSLLDKLAQDWETKKRLKEAGIERAKRYTWKSTAQRTLPVLTQWENGATLK